MPRAIPAVLAKSCMAVLGWALPPRCPACGVPVSDDHRFCAECWSGLRFLGPPWCAGCNSPMPYPIDGGRCAQCLADPPRHAGIRAAVGYGPAARTVALRLKYGGRLGLADTAATHMRRLMPDDAELIIPVPLHRWRLWRRGYNQAALIARSLQRRTAVPAACDVLRRTRATPVLRGLGSAGRRRAVQGAFVIRPGMASALNGRRVVLVDDVYTSGATTDACLRILLAAGAASVTILCWTRVLHGDHDDEGTHGN